MDENVLQNLDLHQASEEGAEMVFHLNDAFFRALAQEEILGGDVEFRLRVRRRADSIYLLNVSVDGVVQTPCDRCLDPVSIHVEAEDELRAVHDDESFADEAEVLLTDKRSDKVDLSWTAYEIIETSLPLERCHDRENCNPEMLARISGTYEGEE